MTQEQESPAAASTPQTEKSAAPEKRSLKKFLRTQWDRYKPLSPEADEEKLGAIIARKNSTSRIIGQIRNDSLRHLLLILLIGAAILLSQWALAQPPHSMAEPRPAISLWQWVREYRANFDPNTPITLASAISVPAIFALLFEKSDTDSSATRGSIARKRVLDWTLWCALYISALLLIPTLIPAPGPFDLNRYIIGPGLIILCSILATCLKPNSELEIDDITIRKLKLAAY